MELKLGSIPLRIHGWFFLMALMTGANQLEPVKLAMWVTVVLVSVTVHELGHALVGRAFGLVPSIDLHGMGGTTSFDAGSVTAPLGSGKRIAISLAGPLAGFAFAAAVFAAQRVFLRPTHPLAIHALALVFAVNVGWGIFNLLPMLPLDGGSVMRSGLDALSKKHGEKIAHVISVLVAGALALYSINQHAWWILYLAALFAFRNVQALREVSQRRTDRSLFTAIEDAHRSLVSGRPADAIAYLKPALTDAASADVRQVGVRIWISALLAQERGPEAASMIEREHAVIPDDEMAHYARVFRERGEAATALRLEQLRGEERSELRAFRA